MDLLDDDFELDDLISSAQDDQYYIEDAWDQAVDKYIKLWGEEIADNLRYDVDIKLNPNVSTRQDGPAALAITQPSKDKKGATVTFSTVVIDEDETDQSFEVWNIILHEMCHAAAYFTDGSLDHKATWHSFVDKLNDIGYEIVESQKITESVNIKNTEDDKVYYVICGNCGRDSYEGKNRMGVSNLEDAVFFESLEEAEQEIKELMARPPVEWNTFTQTEDECIGGTFMHNSHYGDHDIIWDRKNFVIKAIRKKGWEEFWQDGWADPLRQYDGTRVVKKILEDGETGTTLYRGIDSNDKIFKAVFDNDEKVLNNGEPVEVDLRVTSATSNQKVLDYISNSTGIGYRAVVVFDKSTLAYKMQKTQSEYTNEDEYLLFGKFKLQVLDKDHYIIPQTKYYKWKKDYRHRVKFIRATPIDQSREQAGKLLKKMITKRADNGKYRNKSMKRSVIENRWTLVKKI